MTITIECSHAPAYLAVAFDNLQKITYDANNNVQRPTLERRQALHIMDNLAVQCDDANARVLFRRLHDIFKGAAT